MVMWDGQEKPKPGIVLFLAVPFSAEEDTEKAV